MPSFAVQKSTTPGLLRRIANAKFYSNEILERKEDGALNLFQSFLVSATDNLPKAAGSTLALIAAPLWGIKLFNDSNSDDSFFTSNKFIGLLTIGSIASFVTNLILPEIKPEIKKEENIPPLEGTSPVQSVKSNAGLLSNDEEIDIANSFIDSLEQDEETSRMISSGPEHSLLAHVLGVTIINPTTSDETRFIQKTIPGNNKTQVIVRVGWKEWLSYIRSVKRKEIQVELLKSEKSEAYRRILVYKSSVRQKVA